MVAPIAAAAPADTPIERGRYLVETVGACGNCHSPVDLNGSRTGPALSGGSALLSPAYAPHITPDPRTGIGTCSEDEVADALREGHTGRASARLCPCRSAGRCRTPTPMPADRLGAGGLSVDLAWESRTATNITPDPDTGLGRRTDDEIVAALSRGVSKNGARLSTIMPWPSFHGIKPEDPKAVVTWLRTLKPVLTVALR